MTEYEIEHMPRSPTGQRMLKRVSPIYDNSFFMKNFYEAVGGSFDAVRAFFETLREQHFASQVTWGIEYLEHKYSIIPDRTLSLEERRARLKIKTATHRPLNPAILEKAARELYGVELFLDESTAGYITLNIGADLGNFRRVDEFIKYLLEEKPAHLMLRTTTSLDEPAELYIGVANHERGIVTIGSEQIPPFIGVANHERGIVTIDSDKDGLSFALLAYQCGVVTLGSEQIPPFIGMANHERGIVTIDSDKDGLSFALLAYQCGVVTLGSEQIPPFIGMAHYEYGTVSINAFRENIPEGQAIRLHFQFATYDKVLTIKNPRTDLTTQEIEEIGAYAKENNLLFNGIGEPIQRINAVDIINGSEETTIYF